MSDQIEPGKATRRGVFAGAGAVGAASLLAACGGEDAPTVSASTAPTTATTTAAKGASGTVVAKTADIPVGGGKIFPEQGVVVTQPTANVFVGFDSICTHQQCVLTSVSDGKINCACHFSAFAINDGGVLSPPASKPLTAKELKVEGEEIRLA
jgi:nitrite reductase/ring-hydroxylating ferredoxin subunit